MLLIDDEILRFERRLREAVDRFGEGLRRHLAAETGPGSTCPGDIGHAERLRILAAEEARLRRKARRGAPSYDLERHIAVRRLLGLWSVPAAPPRLSRSSPAAARGTRRTDRPA